MIMIATTTTIRRINSNYGLEIVTCSTNITKDAT